MPISDEANWKKWKDSNQDAYGGACVAVANRVMELIDNDPGNFDARKLVQRADRDTDGGGITLAMAGAVASMVSQCHSRGGEFRRKWDEKL